LQTFPQHRKPANYTANLPKKVFVDLIWFIEVNKKVTLLYKKKKLLEWLFNYYYAWGRRSSGTVG
jgi:hypothetical protein